VQTGYEKLAWMDSQSETVKCFEWIIIIINSQLINKVCPVEICKVYRRFLNGGGDAGKI